MFLFAGTGVQHPAAPACMPTTARWWATTSCTWRAFPSPLLAGGPPRACLALGVDPGGASLQPGHVGTLLPGVALCQLQPQALAELSSPGLAMTSTTIARVLISWAAAMGAGIWRRASGGV